MSFAERLRQISEEVAEDASPAPPSPALKEIRQLCAQEAQNNETSVVYTHSGPLPASTLTQLQDLDGFKVKLVRRIPSYVCRCGTGPCTCEKFVYQVMW